MRSVLALSEQTKQETQGYFDIQHNGTADPSGIVKGWAILQAAHMLKEAGFTNFYIDAGGDIQVSGKNSRGNRRFFTLASSPTEEFLHLGVRLYANSSSFKKALYRVDGRTKMIAGQIAGDFTLPQDPRQKLVFIAGGVGITPFRSMLKYLLDMNQRRDIVLFYSNRTADEIAYQDIIREAQTKLGIKTFYTLTKTETIPRNWSGLVGRIDENMIEEAVPDYEERTYYVSGPPDMVRAYEHILKNLGVKSNQVKKDLFPGLV